MDVCVPVESPCPPWLGLGLDTVLVELGLVVAEMPGDGSGWCFVTEEEVPRSGL